MWCGLRLPIRAVSPSHRSISLRRSPFLSQIMKLVRRDLVRGGPGCVKVSSHVFLFFDFAVLLYFYMLIFRLWTLDLFWNRELKFHLAWCLCFHRSSQKRTTICGMPTIWFVLAILFKLWLSGVVSCVTSSYFKLASSQLIILRLFFLLILSNMIKLWNI